MHIIYVTEEDLLSFITNAKNLLCKQINVFQKSDYY